MPCTTGSFTALFLNLSININLTRKASVYQFVSTGPCIGLFDQILSEFGIVRLTWCESTRCICVVSLMKVTCRQTRHSRRSRTCRKCKYKWCRYWLALPLRPISPVGARCICECNDWSPSYKGCVTEGLCKQSNVNTQWPCTRSAQVDHWAPLRVLIIEQSAASPVSRVDM